MPPKMPQKQPAAPNLLDYAVRVLDPTWVMRQSRMEADRWQVDLLNSEESQVFVLCSRQAGKSTTAAAKAVRKAICEPGSLILLLSPSLRQSSELFRKVLDFYKPVAQYYPGKNTALTMDLENGSRIVSLPGTGDTVRGYSAVALLIIDEACMVPEDLYTAVRPMLAVSRGQMVALSTPKGKRGWFYESWSDDSLAIERISVPVQRISRISEAFLEEERKSLGALFFSQEYECQFHDLEQSLFTLDEIEQAVVPSIKPLFGGASGGADAPTGIKPLGLAL